MTHKQVYSRQQLLQIAEAVKDRLPTASESAVYNIVEDAAPKSVAPSAALNHTAPNRRGAAAHGSSASANSSNTAPSPPSNVTASNSSNATPSSATTATSAAAAAAARFAPDKRWGASAEANARDAQASSASGSNADRRGASARTARGGAATATTSSSSSSWRGGRDRETFEEGYLYELKQSEKHKQVLEQAVLQREQDNKRESAAAAAAAAAKAAAAKAAEVAAAPAASTAPQEPPSLTDELEAMFSQMKKKNNGVEDDEPDIKEVEAPVTTTAKRSRFFTGGEAEEAPAPAPAAQVVDVKDRLVSAAVHQAQPAPKVVEPWNAWEQREAQEAKAAAAQDAKINAQLLQKPVGTKVWSAEALEQQLTKKTDSPAASVNLRALQLQTSAPSKPPAPAPASAPAAAPAPAKSPAPTGAATGAPAPAPPPAASAPPASSTAIDVSSLESTFIVKKIVASPAPATPPTTSSPAVPTTALPPPPAQVHTPPQQPQPPPAQAQQYIVPQSVMAPAGYQPAYGAVPAQQHGGWVMQHAPGTVYNTVQYGAYPQHAIAMAPQGQGRGYMIMSPQARPGMHPGPQGQVQQVVYVQQSPPTQYYHAQYARPQVQTPPQGR